MVNLVLSRKRKRVGVVFTKKVRRKIVPFIQRVPRPNVIPLGEKKHHRISSTGNSTDWDGTSFHLSAIAQGITDSQRIGRQVTPISLYVKAFAAVGDTYNRCRLIVVQDTNSCGSVPSVSDILQNTGSLLSTISTREDSTLSRFRTLYDKVVTVDTATPSKAFPKKFIKLDRSLKMTWESTAGTSPSANQLYMVQISDSSAATHPTMAHYMEFRYTDL